VRGSGRTMAVMWVDGEIVSPDDRVLRPDDHCLVGDGAFEAIKVLDGRPFALTRHLRRLAASAAPLGIDVDLATIHAAVDALMRTEQASISPSWLRITVTGGSTPMGSGAVGARPTIVAAVAPMAPWPATTDVVIAPWTRNESSPTAGLKTISYADNVIALRHAHRAGSDEAVFANTQGQLCEGTGSNVFVAHRGQLVTPTLASGCLAGVTRELLLEWFPEIIESDVPISALAQADEAFLTSTSRDVHPIARVDGVELAAAPGPLTAKATEAWSANAARHHDP
jgi:branched-chain amino acid aminotransferase